MKKIVLGIFAGILVASTAHADDWPQFRGPDRSGVSKETGLLKAWPKEGPKLAWTFKNAGLGHSSVAVVKGVVYTLGTDFDTKTPKSNDFSECIIAIDESKGTELWRHKIGHISTYPAPSNAYGDGPRSTPTIDGNLLFALSGNGQLVCLDLAAKKELWRKHLVKDLDGVMGKYGYSESVLIDGDKLICSPGGPKGTLAALDKKTGSVIWHTKDLTNLVHYTSPVVADFHGVRQYVQTSYVSKPGDIHGEVAGVDTKGNLLWTGVIYTGENEGSASTPIISGNEVYVSVGFGGGCHLFQINAMQKAKEIYKKATWKKVKNRHGGLVLLDGFLYGHSERDMWVCQQLKNGDVEWDERTQLTCQDGGITAADGKLYLYTDDGEVGLVDADPKAFNLVSSFKVPERTKISPERTTSRMAKIWSYPVIANGVLYLRDQEYIFAYKIK